MRKPALSSMTPDQARTQYLNHVGDCARCRKGSGRWRRPCKAGKRLKHQERHASLALIAAAREAC